MLAEASTVLDPTLQATLARLQEAGLSAQQAFAAINRSIVEQAYMLSSLDIFWFTAWLALAMVVVTWFAQRPSVASGMSVAAE